MAPQFWVGIRFGSGPELSLTIGGSEMAPVQTITFRTMRKQILNGTIEPVWGSRNPAMSDSAYLGDQFFDYHFHGSRPLPVAVADGPVWRPVGAPGQILFHIVSDDRSNHPVVAVGLGIPLGGPDHFAAKVRS